MSGIRTMDTGREAGKQEYGSNSRSFFGGARASRRGSRSMNPPGMRMGALPLTWGVCLLPWINVSRRMAAYRRGASFLLLLLLVPPGS